MNYQKIYDNLVSRARNRKLEEGIYFEQHHVIPKCLGGSDHPYNLVKMTAEEHFVAHQLLVKIHSTHTGLAYAALRMTIGPKGRVNNKLYGWLRKKVSISSSINSKNRIAKYGHPKGMKGKHHSDETKQRQSKNITSAYVEKGLTFPICQFTMDGVFIQKFVSLQEAARSVNGNPINLKYCAEGKFQYMQGFRWSFDENAVFESIKERQYVGNRGKMWITNEKDSITIDRDSIIPDGWKKGRTIKKK